MAQFGVDLIDAAIKAKLASSGEAESKITSLPGRPLTAGLARVLKVPTLAADLFGPSYSESEDSLSYQAFDEFAAESFGDVAVTDLPIELKGPCIPLRTVEGKSVTLRGVLYCGAEDPVVKELAVIFLVEYQGAIESFLIPFDVYVAQRLGFVRMQAPEPQDEESAEGSLGWIPEEYREYRDRLADVVLQ